MQRSTTDSGTEFAKALVHQREAIGVECCRRCLRPSAPWTTAIMRAVRGALDRECGIAAVVFDGHQSRSARQQVLPGAVANDRRPCMAMPGAVAWRRRPTRGAPRKMRHD